jgi:superfamily I DNA/RNA helicase
MAYQKFVKKDVGKKTFKMKFPPSKRQVDVLSVLDYILSEESLPLNLWPLRDKIRKAIVVNACAGSGKTTLLMYILSQVTNKQALRILLTSFANSIVDELKAYVWQFPGTTAQGLHSIGNGIISSSFGKPVLRNTKIADIAKQYDGFDPWEEEGEDRADAFKRVKLLSRICELCKMTLTDWKDESAVLEMISQYGVDVNDSYSDVMEVLGRVMRKSVETTNIIDFPDMLFMPVHLGLKFPRYDVVFGDECQDYNRAQQEMIKRMSDKFVMVGDRYQAIYGFAGADMQSIPNMIDGFEAVEMPLDVNYRCPKSVVKVAQGIVGQLRPDGTHTIINAWEGATDGEVKTIPVNQFFDTVQIGDFVMCRKNAPLVGPCFELLKRGVKSSLKGKDISQQIIELFNKICKKSQSIEDCVDLIDSYRERESAKITKRFKESAASQIEVLDNKIDTLLEFVNRAKEVSEIIPMIEGIFKESSGDGEVALGSCHYSKGLEFDRCFILEWDDFGTMYKNSTASDMEQRRNLRYIAVTRAKKALFLVNKKEDESEPVERHGAKPDSAE